MTKSVISSETLFSHPFASLSLESVQHENGKVKKALALKKKDAVCVTIIDTHTQELLFVSQFRAPVASHKFTGTCEEFSAYTLEPVAGHIEEGQTPTEAAIREIEEETTLTVTNLRQIAKGFTSPGISTEMHYHFVAEFDSSKIDMTEFLNKIHGLEDEDIEIKMISLDKALEMVANGEIYSSHAIVGIFYLQGQRK